MTLALALAANATTFSLMDAIVLRPYRFAGVDRLLAIASQSPNAPIVERETVTRADFRDWQREAKTVSQLAAFEWWQPNLSGIENPEQVPGFKVSPEFFSLVGVTPIVGRTFLPDEAEPGRHQRVVLGHALWTRRFASDRSIVGRTVRLDGESYEVVGIAPEGFQMPLGAQVWAPISYDAKAWEIRTDANFTVIGRLADGASLETARAEFNAIVERQRKAYPDTNGKREVAVVSFSSGMNDPGAGPFIGTWQAAAGLLLLIACANIANLLLARGGERSQEFAIRLALGAGRGRLFWQTILEGLMLSSLAVAASVPLAMAGLGLSRRSIPDEVIRFVPGWSFIRLDLRLLLFTALLGVVAMLIFSLVPALQATRAQVSEGLRHSSRTLTPGRRRNWTRNVLATAQVALTLAVLFGSGLMLSAADRATTNLGFDKNNLLVAEVNLPARTYRIAGVAAPLPHQRARQHGRDSRGHRVGVHDQRAVRKLEHRSADLARGAGRARRRSAPRQLPADFAAVFLGAAHSPPGRARVQRCRSARLAAGRDRERRIRGNALAGAGPTRAPFQDRRRRPVDYGGRHFGQRRARLVLPAHRFNRVPALHAGAAVSRGLHAAHRRRSDGPGGRSAPRRRGRRSGSADREPVVDGLARSRRASPG